jgi:hypothetical protein
MTPTRTRDSATRTIRFYRWTAPSGEDGGEIPVDIEAALRVIERRPFAADERYLELDNGDATCAWVDPAGGSGPRMRLGTLRRGDWPQIERAGQLRELSSRDEESVAETTHACFFDHQIVGSEFNFYGPRVRSRLPVYLAERGGAPFLTLTPILRQDAAARLDGLRDIRLLHLRLRAGYFDAHPDSDNDMVEMFNAARRAGDPREVEVILRVQPYSRDQTLGGRILAFAKRLATQPGIREDARAFMARGLNSDGDGIDEVDVLQDSLFVSAEIRRAGPRGRALDTADTYRAIDAAYRENRDQLEAGAAAMLQPNP